MVKIGSSSVTTASGRVDADAIDKLSGEVAEARATGIRVVGRVAERAVALNDLTTDEAADYVQGRLRRIGVDRALARAGARDGDLVHIGELTFVWYRDQPEFTGDPAGRRRRSW